MASLKEIRARIESTKNTQQITRAMKLVSAAKLRRAQQQVTQMRPYALSLRKVIRDISSSSQIEHPLLQASGKKDNPSVLLVMLTSDRGLCGGFNSAVSKETEVILRNRKANQKIDFITIGKRGADYIARKGFEPLESITKLDKDVSYVLAEKVAEQLLVYFLDGYYDEIRLVYNEFLSAISQRVVSEKLLPIDLSLDAEESQVRTDFIFEPQPAEMIDDLLKKNFALQVYRCMCESVAAEHGARMTAMENATNNAKEFINSLTLTYNKLRQEKITRELIEIVSGAEALK